MDDKMEDFKNKCLVDASKYLDEIVNVLKPIACKAENQSVFAISLIQVASSLCIAIKFPKELVAEIYKLILEQYDDAIDTQEIVTRKIQEMMN